MINIISLSDLSHHLLPIYFLGGAVYSYHFCQGISKLIDVESDSDEYKKLSEKDKEFCDQAHYLLGFVDKKVIIGLVFAVGMVFWLPSLCRKGYLKIVKGEK